MVKNDFIFGAMVDNYMKTEMDQIEDFFEIFNYGVLRNEMKWYHQENTQGNFNYDDSDWFMDWFDAHNVTFRGHAVFWSVDQFVQNWVQEIAQSDPAQLEQLVFDRAEAAVGRYKGRIPNWDTFNEVIHGDFFKRFLGDDIWNRVIDRIKEIDSDLGIIFNDYQLLTADKGQERVRIVSKSLTIFNGFFR